MKQVRAACAGEPLRCGCDLCVEGRERRRLVRERRAESAREERRAMGWPARGRPPGPRVVSAAPSPSRPPEFRHPAERQAIGRAPCRTVLDFTAFEASINLAIDEALGVRR